MGIRNILIASFQIKNWKVYLMYLMLTKMGLLILMKYKTKMNRNKMHDKDFIIPSNCLIETQTVS